MPSPKSKGLPVSKTWVAAFVLCLLTAVIAAALWPATSQAQGQERFVDLSVELDINEDSGSAEPDILLRVSNLGNQAAYEVFSTRAGYVKLGLHSGSLHSGSKEGSYGPRPRLPP